MANTKSIFLSLIFLFVLLPAPLLAQSQNGDIVVGFVDDEPITYNEVINNFSKGNNSSFTFPELEKFLPLYLDFRAKLLFAEDQGYHQDSALVAEHNLYAKQAAYAHWLNKEIHPSLFEKYYERAQVELKSYHVLIATPPNATPGEIEAAKEKLLQAKKEIQNGGDLAEINKKYSSVQRGRSMGGELPWLSAGRTVIEFEDQLYSLEPGEISEPFASQFGYHIVMLIEKRERTPARMLSHIFVRPSRDSSASNKINEAYNYLEEGRSWTEVTNEYSEDGMSARNNGSIGWVSYKSSFAPTFIDKVLKLDPSLKYTEPIRTNYGFHIFRIDSVQTFKSEEHQKQELKSDFKNSGYYKENNSVVVDYLEEDLGSSVKSEAVNAYENFIAGFDSTEISNIALSPALASETVYEFNGQTYSVADLHQYIVDTFGDDLAVGYNGNWFDKFTQFVVDSQIIDITMAAYPEFKKQSESYFNGLIVYKLNDDYMWSAATVDSSKLVKIYENDSQKYRYEARPHFYMLSASTDSILNVAMDFIRSGNSPDSVTSEFSTVWVSSDSTSTYTDEPFNRLNELSPETFSEIFDYKNHRSVFYLKDNLPARKMTFEEAFNRLLANYQPEREKAWLKDLRAKYKVKADFKHLKEAYIQDSESF